MLQISQCCFQVPGAMLCCIGLGLCLFTFKKLLILNWLSVCVAHFTVLFPGSWCYVVLHWFGVVPVRLCVHSFGCVLFVVVCCCAPSYALWCCVWVSRAVCVLCCVCMCRAWCGIASVVGSNTFLCIHECVLVLLSVARVILKHGSRT